MPIRIEHDENGLNYSEVAQIRRAAHRRKKALKILVGLCAGTGLVLYILNDTGALKKK